MPDAVTVDALLRDPTPQEVSEGLERNPGSGRLAERGWRPLWFEVRIAVGDRDDVDHIHSLVWAQAGRDLDDVAAEELEHTLDEALRNLRDLEGHDVWPEDVATRTIRVQAERR
jgi:hypothetical protein